MTTVFLSRPTLALALLLSVPAGSFAAELPSETQLITVLQSRASWLEKNAACWELKRVGTVRCIPALAALLTDERLSHTARYALESLPSPEAGAALLQALGKTTGPVRVGLIQSLGVRKEPAAVPALSPWLTQPDAVLASAAASALGEIADAPAVAALQAAKAKLAADGAGAVVNALNDALLHCGQRLLADGHPPEALVIFNALFQDKTDGAVRLAAFRGMILAGGETVALDLITNALTGNDAPCQAAALALVRDCPAKGATTAFAGLLPRVPPPVQIALIGNLAQRGDAAAAPAIATAVKSADPHVRTAAFAALGLLDDSASIPLLAQAAATATGDEQAAARQALTLLHGGHPAEVMLAALPTVEAPVQAELARALGERSETSAVPKLFDLVRTGADSVAKAALSALARLVSPAQLPDLVALLVQARNESVRAAAAETVNTACQRLQARFGHLDPTPITRGLATASASARITLLPVCSGLADPQVRAVLRAAVTDPNAGVRAAALRALAETVDPELIPDLLQAARTTPEPNLRSVAIGGWIRLAIREPNGKTSLASQIEGLTALMGAAASVEQKRLLLSGLGEVIAPQTLALAGQLLGESEVRLEAAQAVVNIARSLPDATPAAAALQQVVALPEPNPLRQNAQTVLKELEARASYITDWRIAGPFRQAGKDYAALFDIPFAPETDGTGDWRPIPAGTDPKRPWLLDLLKALGGEQCVAYARTWVFAEKATPARLEIGADDGVKVWLNHQFLHGNNASRALSPGSDKMTVNLVAGWNLLLLKVTQNNQGWEYCARFVQPDGSPLGGLKIDANHPAP